jgi:WD40 repeat protein
MPPSNEPDRAEFQRAIDALANNTVLTLMPREYPGPIVISRPLVIDGQGSTIWALKGPVILCQSDGIILRNIEFRVTGDVEGGQSEDHCVLKVERGYPPTFENVEVRGSIIGIPEEEGDWRYPHTLQIGSVPFGSETDLIMRLWVPVPCEISSKISGLEIQPHRLEPGTNEVTLHIERIAKDTLLSGFLYITTPKVRRSIVLSGYISATKGKKSRSKKPVEPTIIYQPGDWDDLLTRPRPQHPVKLPPPPPPPRDPSGISLPDPRQSSDQSHPETRPSESPVVLPPSGGLTQPSGPSIQWPPPPTPPPPSPPVITPPVITPPVITPQPPVPAPVPPPVPPVVGPSGGSSSGTSPVPATNGKRKLLVAAILGVALILIAGAAWWFFWSGGTIDPARVKELNKLEQMGEEVTAVAFSPDGKMLAGGSKSGVIKLWVASTGAMQPQQPPKKHDGKITSLAFSSDRKSLVSGSADSNVIIWDLEHLSTPKVKTTLRDEVNAIAISPNGETIVCGVKDGTVRFLSGKDGQQQNTVLSVGSPVMSVAFSVDGKIVVTGAQDGSIKIWDAASGGMKQQLYPKHDGIVMSLIYSNDGSILASGGADRKLILWNVESWQIKPPSPFLQTDQVSAIAFSPDDKIVVSAGAGHDSTLRLWDVQEGGTPKKLLVDHSAPVNSLAVSRNGIIASGSSDKTIRLWGTR